MISRLLGMLVLLLFLPTIQAQPVDTLLTGLEHIASIPDARQLAIDAEGVLYIVTEREIVLVDVEGQVQARLGGSGIDDGAFEEVADIDPGAGLIWVVADAGGGKLMRFSRTLLHLETLLVPPAGLGESWRASREDPRSDELQDVGRPIAVAVGVGGELFAIEETAQRVLKWDASRRFERTIGDFDATRGQLQDPVSLAVDAEHLYVADRGLGAVLAFDYFGGFVRRYAARDDVSNVWAAGGELWVVLQDAVWVFAVGGRIRGFRFELEDPLLAAAAVGPWLVLLTPGKIWRVKI